jgi:hypothetical protein
MFRQSLAEKKIPSLKEFTDCGTGVEFQNLEGKEGMSLVSDLNMKTNLFWIHPLPMWPSRPPVLQGIHTSSPSYSLPQRLRQQVIGAIQGSKQALQPAGVPIWAVERGYATLVPISDPLDTNEKYHRKADG